MKRLAAILLALTLAGTVFVGCGKKSTSESAASGSSKELTVAVTAVGNNLDPVVANYTDTSSIMSHVYDNLLNVDSKFNVTEGVVSSWSQPDSTTYELTMGKGYVFQNGQAATLDDMMYSLQRYANISQKASVWKNIASVTGNGNVMTVKLKSADSSFLRDLVSTPLLSKSYCEKVGDKYANAPIGTGPYKVASYTPGESVVLETWDAYPSTKPSIQKITYKGIKEDSARYMAIESGSAQFSAVSASDLKRAKSNSKLSTNSTVSTTTGFVAMNTSKAPFNNVTVRQAMAYAYNTKGYLSVATGSKSVIDSMFLKGTPYYSSASDKISYNLKKAQELLASAGYTKENPLTFTIAGYGATDPVMQAYQADLSSIGVKVTLQSYEFGTFLNMMQNKKYDMLAGSWSEPTGDPLSAAECYWSGSFGSMNISFYSNSKTDELYNQLKASTDKTEMTKISQEIQTIAWQDVPMFPTYTTNETYAYVKGLSNVDISAVGTVSFRHAKLS